MIRKKKISLKPETIEKIQGVAPFAGPLVMLGVAGIYMVKIQKESARMGRYKAKQELLKDPNNFITYNDEQMDSVKNLTAPKPSKNFFDKTIDCLKSPIELFKDFKEYEQYKKTTEKEEAKLDKALMQIKVTDEQLKESKSLQKNAFMAFEKLDEKAQRYTDDTEGATDIAKQYILQICNLGLGAIFLRNGLKIINEGTNQTSFISKFLAKSWVPMSIITAIEIFTEWQANKIKTQAGRIGVMEAMQDLEDPKLFVNQ